MNTQAPLIIKSCHSHIGGKFGKALTERLIKLGWIARIEGQKDYTVTSKGEREFKKIGIDTSTLK
jgi:predicted transcriptional regulator